MRWAVAIVLCLLAASCGRPAEDDRTVCLVAALQQPGLAHGVVAYSQTGGTMQTAAGDMVGRVRLALDWHYEAASLTKPRVAYAVRRMVESGQLQLDDTAASLLPGFRFGGAGTQQITVRHLLQHTAGLGYPPGRDPLWYRGGAHEGDPDCAAAARHALRYRTRHVPGVHATYANAGYCLLGEVLLRRADDAGVQPAELEDVLRSPLGAAGGWQAPLPEIHRALAATLPPAMLPSPAEPLPDGSWYAYGWRYWPRPDAGAPWTHTGRLPGMLAVALSNGRDQLIVAHFDGDPADYHAAAARFGRQAWPCMSK